MAVDQEIEERLDWLERAVTVLAESMPMVNVRLPPRPGEADANADQEIRALVAAGQTLQAVRAYQNAHGAGLKEAKRAVDGLAEQLRRG